MGKPIQGYAGYQLRINLNNCQTTIEPISLENSYKFLGGSGYGVKLLYDELPKGMDPLSSASKLIFATGPLSLNQIPGGGSLMICFKSPLTGAWGESRVGGDFAPDMKRAGFDYIIIEGKSEAPVYLLINNHQVEFRSARHLLGKKVSEKLSLLSNELGGKEHSILCIGPAGENLVKYASIMYKSRAAGRCGAGAVMGSKNLLAVAVTGDHPLDVAQPEKLKQILKQAFSRIRGNPNFHGLQDFGTIGDLPANDDGGDWPSKNWQSNSWGEGEKLYNDYSQRNFIRNYGCYKGCTIACGRKVHVPDGKYKTIEHGGAEYESITAFTAYLLNTDMDAAIRGTYLCNEYGIDTISTGGVIAFAMECYERGLLEGFSVQPLDLSWGNAEILESLIEMISERKGIGDLLAEGVRSAAQRIGQGSEEFAIHVKGLEGPAHDPRSGKALAVTYGTGTRGMCHIHPLEGMAWDRGKLDWGMQKYGVTDPNQIDRWDEKGKGRNVKILQDGLVIPDVVGTCKFYMYAGLTLDDWAEMISALTGWTITGHNLLMAGERVINLQRLFNLREGLSPSDDQIPGRIKTLPTFGKYSGEPACEIKDFDAMLDEYYLERGWDKGTGRPSKEKITELGLTYEADLFESN
ncbi:MAG: aldehyde ferredoxin oxidoreductase family protein [Chloroflexi bacterium]|nr:aldehyde ferredoxin oxidoreductase family protein [Chloroflexota bacterium]